MTETIQRKINDSAFARWTALVLIASTMFFGYMFVDVLSPLKSLLETSRGWNSTVFGLYGGSEFILNVCGFLIVAGIILDKMGVRFTGLLSASLMVAGAAVKTYGISEYFCQGGFGFEFFSSFLTDIRLRNRNGGYHRLEGHRQVVHRKGDGAGDGSRDGHRPAGRLRRVQPLAVGG